MYALETIPEETELPRISQLIPKSPETIKREIETRKICDEYLNDQNLRLYYAMLVTNQNFRQLCMDKSMPSFSDDSSDCSDSNDLPRKSSLCHVEQKKKQAAKKCNVSTSITEEDINYFYNGKIAIDHNNSKKCNNSNSNNRKNNKAKPFHPSNTNTQAQIKWMNNNNNNKNCDNNNNNNMSNNNKNNAINQISDGEHCHDAYHVDDDNSGISGSKIPAMKKCNVSTSIPTEDIQMLCANFVRYNNGCVQ